MVSRILQTDITSSEGESAPAVLNESAPARQSNIRLTSSVRDRNNIQRKLKLAEKSLGYDPKSREPSKDECWKNDAWDAYECVEVVGQAVDTVAKGVAKGKLAVAVETDSGELDSTDSKLPNMVLREFKGPRGRHYRAFLLSAAQTLQVSGDGYFVAHKADPKHENDKLESDNDGRPIYKEWEFVSDQEISVVLNESSKVLSVYRNNCGERQAFSNYGTAGLGTGLQKSSKVKLDRDVWYISRGFRPNPRYSQLSDSALKKNLKILSEMRKLDNHVHSTVDSKMPSGILLVPTQITLEASDIVANPIEVENGAVPEYFDQFDIDFFDHFATPITDQSDPISRLPFLIRGAAEYLKEVRHLDVSKNLDMIPQRIRAELLQRLYVGLDIPKEIIEGKGSLNHWTGSNVDSNLTSNHVIPLGELIADLITEHYFRPVLVQRGMDPCEAERYSVIFDPSEILPRADRSTIAIKLYELEVISERALLEASGFSITDAPNANERRQRLIFKLILSSPVTLAPLLMPKLDGLEDVAEELEAIRLAAENRDDPLLDRNERASEPAGDDQRGRNRGGRGISQIPKTTGDNTTRNRTSDLPPSEERRVDSDRSLSVDAELQDWISNNQDLLEGMNPLLGGKTADEIASLVISSHIAKAKPEVNSGGETIYSMDATVESQLANESTEEAVLPELPQELLEPLAESIALVRVQVMAIASRRIGKALKLKRAELDKPNALGHLDPDDPNLSSQATQDDLDYLGLEWSEILESSPRDNLASVVLETIGGWMTFNLSDNDSGNNAPVLASSICQASADYIISTIDIEHMTTEQAMNAARSVIEISVRDYFSNVAEYENLA